MTTGKALAKANDALKAASAAVAVSEQKIAALQTPPPRPGSAFDQRGDVSAAPKTISVSALTRIDDTQRDQGLSSPGSRPGRGRAD
jgi:hypothetical protein